MEPQHTNESWIDDKVLCCVEPTMTRMRATKNASQPESDLPEHSQRTHSSSSVTSQIQGNIKP